MSERCGLKGMESGMAECFTPIAEKYGKALKGQGFGFYGLALRRSG